MPARPDRRSGLAPGSAIAHLRPYSVLGSPWEVRILDLSPVGARIEHSQLLRPGFICTLAFQTRRSSLKIAVQVVHTKVVAIGHLRYETGLAFVQVDAEQREFLQELLVQGMTREESDAGTYLLSLN